MGWGWGLGVQGAEGGRQVRIAVVDGGVGWLAAVEARGSGRARPGERTPAPGVLALASGREAGGYGCDVPVCPSLRFLQSHPSLPPALPQDLEAGIRIGDVYALMVEYWWVHGGGDQVCVKAPGQKRSEGYRCGVPGVARCGVPGVAYPNRETAVLVGSVKRGAGQGLACWPCPSPHNLFFPCSGLGHTTP